MRINKPKDLSSEELCKLVVKGMQEKKAVDIVVMDLRDVKKCHF
jgi:ribosome-associated protein